MKPGYELRSIRLSLGIPQTKLAKAIGVSQAALSKAERGKTRLTASHMAAVHRFARQQFENLKKASTAKR
jgi:transcriptional regulator with XRE-family HTH domain